MKDRYCTIGTCITVNCILYKIITIIFNYNKLITKPILVAIGILNFILRRFAINHIYI